MPEETEVIRDQNKDLRDFFAGQCLPTVPTQHELTDHEIDIIARNAYRVAEAMMRIRN